MGSMWMPQLHPSVSLGVLAMLIGGVSDWRMGGAMCVSEYHWRKLEWMCLAAGVKCCVEDRSDDMCDCW